MCMGWRNGPGMAGFQWGGTTQKTEFGFFTLRSLKIALVCLFLFALLITVNLNTGRELCWVNLLLHQPPHCQVFTHSCHLVIWAPQGVNAFSRRYLGKISTAGVCVPCSGHCCFNGRGLVLRPPGLHLTWAGYCHADVKVQHLVPLLPWELRIAKWNWGHLGTHCWRMSQWSEGCTQDGLGTSSKAAQGVDATESEPSAVCSAGSYTTDNWGHGEHPEESSPTSNCQNWGGGPWLGITAQHFLQKLGEVTTWLLLNIYLLFLWLTAFSKLEFWAFELLSCEAWRLVACPLRWLRWHCTVCRLPFCHCCCLLNCSEIFSVEVHFLLRNAEDGHNCAKEVIIEQ